MPDKSHEVPMIPYPTTQIKALFAAVPGYLTALEFGPEKALVALAAMQFLDWLSGTAASRRTGVPISSPRATGGAFKKGMMWVYIAATGVGLWLAPVSTEVARTAYATVVCGFVWVEIVSIAENGEKLGWPMPSFVRGALGVLKPKDGAEIPAAGANGQH